MAFVERVIDVIGADPEVLDSTFRELFSSAGELYVRIVVSAHGRALYLYLILADNLSLAGAAPARNTMPS